MAKNLINLLHLKKFLSVVLTHKLIFGLVLIAVLPIIVIFFPKKTPDILTAKVSFKNIEKTVSVTGDVSSDKTANLSFQAPETLTYVGVKVGDFVTKGEEIAAIDSEKLAATVRQTQQDFMAAKAASEKYYDNHNDTETLSEKVTRTAIDDAQNKAYDQYLKAQYDLNHSVLYSPIDGVVTRVDADTPGVNITPATVFSITDPTALNFKMEVDQADIGKITVSDPVNVSLDSFPDKVVKLYVNTIDFVSHKTSSGGNAFFVKATLSQGAGYRIGMSGNADIITDSKDNVLTIPSTSLGDGSIVYKKIGNKFKKIKVQTGLNNDIDVEILSGLSNGDTVALDSSSVLENQIIK